MTKKTMIPVEGLPRIAAGFAPGVGQALAVDDVQAAAREGDNLGVALGLAGLIPVAGGLAKVAKTARAASKAKKAKALAPEGIAIVKQAAETPENLLRQIGKLSDEVLGGSHPAAPEFGLADGTFGGVGKLNMDDQGNVILTRVANDEDHLGKDWVNVGLKELMDTSMHHGGGQGLPTSGLANWTESFGASRPNKVVGTFKIPAEDLLKAIKDKNAILGNLGEGEIVLNPAFAKRYLNDVDRSKAPSGEPIYLKYKSGGSIENTTHDRKLI